MEEVRQAFELFDRNGDGVVTKAELVEIFDRLGGQIKPAEAAAFLKTVDKDKSGTIDINVSCETKMLIKTFS